MKKKLLILLATCFTLSLHAQEAEREYAFENYHRYYREGQAVRHAEKEQAIDRLRLKFHQQPYRLKSLDTPYSADECLEQLNGQGIFSDLAELETQYLENGDFHKPYTGTQNDKIGLFLGEAFNRIWKIADSYRKGEISAQKATADKVWKAIAHYGNLEAGRPNNLPRFHASCFALPTAAAGIYFSYLPEMNKAEKSRKSGPMKEACDMLKVIGLQAWTQPLRNDETDQNVVSIPRFRNHVWWVGGNALGYRSLLPVAAMYRSVPMVDLLAEICQRGISTTSQNTYSESFWTEGFTADGAGWGHGMQCLIWGYPIDGTANALNILGLLQDSPWAQKLNRENVGALLNFFRGGSWYYYKGYRLPCLDRGSYAYNTSESSIPYSGMLNSLINNWLDSFSSEEQAELLELQREAQRNRINMEAYAPGIYHGIRWFFNNDDLIKKTPDHHIIINMASVRCDGLESATGFADEYNFYTTDGLTLFQRDGNEYSPIMGGWDVTASPGVTAREGMERLTPVTNWRGYCSKHNYAVGATDGENYAVTGYIFEKMNASDKEGVNDRSGSGKRNSILYGFQAHKANFILGDYFIALGAGITNHQPEMEGHIRTTIDQTSHNHPVSILEEGKEKPLSAGVYSLMEMSSTSWVHQQGKFAYRILPEFTSQAFVSCEKRPTDWVKRNRSNEKRKNLPQEVGILRIWVDHGQIPVNDTYGYVVYTGNGLPARELPFEVLSNDTLVQAVCSADKKIVEAVFYPGNSGLQANGISLKASAPCAVVIQEEEKQYVVSVTDACMSPSLKEIRLEFNGKPMIVAMSQGELAGKAVQTTIVK